MCIFDEAGETETHRFVLPHREGDVHFGFIEGLFAGTIYGFRVEGPFDPDKALRFDGSKLLVDPFAWSLDRPFTFHPELREQGVDTAAFVPKCIARNGLPDAPRLPYRKADFVYEINVKAFTMLNPDVPQEKRGTVAALAEPAVRKHLRLIGVDTIELMPIAAWIDEAHLQPFKLRNAWGYNPVQFFAVDPRLAPGGLEEVRETVAALHKQNIRVILDVVINHSGEGDQLGPTICMRGLDNSTYYTHTGSQLNNDTGCGNTISLNDPYVLQMTVAALRHWVLKAGVDGFRFDLASVMGRTPQGFRADAPLFLAIEKDPVLSTCMMIAEPWDIGPGGYQLGHFPKRWQEWNDRYRDDVRKFWRGDNFSANSFATRLAGSSDIFASPRRPSNSINFISAHDGFTMHDIVTFTAKDNFNNGEDNRDGKSDETTWPNGDVRALLTTLFLSRGTPMLTAGDEFGRTQHGNNNAYAQDNEVTWLDWNNKDDSLIGFVSSLTRLRREIKLLHADEFLTEASAFWFDEDGGALQWSNPQQRFFGLLLTNDPERIVVAINGSSNMQKIKIPANNKRKWTKIHTSADGENCPPQSVTVFQEVKI
jgi:glycogen debranching enzyme